MGWLSSLGSALTGGVSNLFSGSDSAADFLDPANLFHEGKAERTANAQWQYEYQLQKQNFEEAKAQNEWNRSMQEKSFEYQKLLNQLHMEREDTATQRRVADLKAAGLSPTLAAGSAADTGALHAGSVSQVSPAQAVPASSVKAQAAMFKEQMMKDQLQLATTLMGNFADISRTKAETLLIDAKYGEQNIINKYLDDYLSGRNLGQTLDNDAKSIGNDFARRANPYRLDKLKEEINKLRTDQNVDKAKEELLKEQKFTEIYDQCLKGLQQSELRKRMDKEDLETLSLAYTLSWAKKHGTPLSGYNQYQFLLDMADRIIGYLADPDRPVTLPPLDKNAPPSLDLDKLKHYQNNPDEIPLNRFLHFITGDAFDFR